MLQIEIKEGKDCSPGTIRWHFGNPEGTRDGSCGIPGRERERHDVSSEDDNEKERKK